MHLVHSPHIVAEKESAEFRIAKRGPVRQNGAPSFLYNVARGRHPTANQSSGDYGNGWVIVYAILTAYNRRLELALPLRFTLRE